MNHITRNIEVVYKPTFSTHAMTIDHEPAIEVEAIMVNISLVAIDHAVAKLLLAHNLPEVLHEELASRNILRRPDAPPLRLRHEPLEVRGPQVLLDPLVRTLGPAGTAFGVALGVDHSVQAVVPASRTGPILLLFLFRPRHLQFSNHVL